MPDNAEKLLISAVLRTGDFTAVQAGNITAEHMHAYRDEFAFLEHYHRKYHAIPSKLAFKNVFPDFQIRPCDDVEHFVDECRNSHIRHRLLESIKDVTDLIGAGDPETAVRMMHAEIVKITAETGVVADADLISDWKGLYDEAKAKAARTEREGLAGISTGVPTLDEATSGYQPGELHVVAARLGERKTWLLLLSATAALLSGKSVQFVSLEMSREQIGWRMHSLLSGAVGKQVFSNIELQQGRNFNPRDYRRFLRSLPSLIKGSLFVADGSRGRNTPTTVAAQIERNGSDIVFIDYIQLMGGNDWQALANVSGEFKSIAQQYKIPIVEAAQFNRERGLAKEMAGPEALAGSDAVGQDADGVVSIKKLSESVLTGKLVKYRHGPSGQRFYMDVRPAEGVFKEVSFNKAMDLKDRDADRQEAREAAEPPRFKPSAKRQALDTVSGV